MDSDIETIYKEIDRIIVNHLMINDNSMKLCQSWGYNGFKRLHRVNSKNLLSEHLKLENCMFDKYRKVLEINNISTDYSPTNLKYHLSKLKDIYYDDIIKIGKLNHEHIKLIGVSNSVAENILKYLNHDYEKVCRWYQRFEENGWNYVDMHLVDDRLHEKIKKIEEG